MNENDVTCPYCARPALLVDGTVIYPTRPDLAHKAFWHCKPCKAYVGCHPPGHGQGDGTKPLGRLANAELRVWKMRTHAAFDPIWKSKSMQRRQAYAWLAGELGIQPDECHIGMFDVEQCQRAAAACVRRAESGGDAPRLTALRNAHMLRDAGQSA